MPVLIRVHKQYFWDVFYIVKELDLGKEVYKNRFFVEVMPFGLPTATAFPEFRLMSTILSRTDIYDLAEDPRIEKIFYDAPMFALVSVPKEGVYEWMHGRKGTLFTTTYWTKKLIGADVANQKGFTGEGMKVAVTDTGLALHHLQMGWRTQFETVMPFQRDDSNGHGTWCATCIAGKRAEDYRKSKKLGKKVLVEGMAPDANLLAIKCLGYVIGTGSTSQIIKAMEMAMNWGADVVSMSLGGKEEAEKPEDDPYYTVLEAYDQKNITATIAAGNSGPKPNTVGSPGALPQALTVGACDPIHDCKVASFSSRGPTNWGDTKPDIVMPGVRIDSGSTGILDVAEDKVEDRFAILDGTSMATPHAAGLVLLMKQAHRKLLQAELTTQEIKRMMEAWAVEHGRTKDNDYGWGLMTWEVYEWWISTQYGVNI